MKKTAVIIGKGPAGIQAALYLLRANIDTVIIGKDRGALAKADYIENYYGFSEPIQAHILLENGEKNARRLGGLLLDDTVVSLKYDDDGFLVETVKETVSCKVVVLATGTSRKKPNVSGISELEGRGVSYCATCDAFFYRGKDVAVLGNGEYALHEAAELLPVAKSVTILLNGEELETAKDDCFIYEPRKLSEVAGSQKIDHVVFEDGATLQLDGLFIAQGTASSTELAQKLGVLTENNNIVVNQRMETNVPGIFAAGDCTGGLLQIAKAAGEGAVAGTSAVKFARQK